MKNECCICNKKIGFFTFKTVLSDGVICGECRAKERINHFDNGGSFTVEGLKEYIATRHPLISSFGCTKRLSHGLGLSRINKAVGLEIDDNNKTFIVNGMDLFETSNLLGYELLEDGESLLKGGVGGAIIGGTLFGGTGAIVGGIVGKKNKKVCNSMRICITVKNSHTDVVFIDVITKTTDAGILYNAALEEAQKYLSALQIMDDGNKSATQTISTNAVDVSAELEKFHDLKERGIITEDEFNTKKAHLLGL